jgi:hypothetical protein
MRLYQVELVPWAAQSFEVRIRARSPEDAAAQARQGFPWKNLRDLKEVTVKGFWNNK